MPKLGMEPIRRAALVKATIAEVGDAGSLDVAVSRIAKRAGMSSGLAHHYFGGKDEIFAAAMRQILTDYRAEVTTALRRTPDRATAVIEASFAPSCFAPETVAAWMTFYAQAHTSPPALRLLRIYQRRLRSTLTHALRGQVDDPRAAAETLAALIDGTYLAMAFGHVPGGTARVLSVLHSLRGQS
ncbi:transcriptional regulator BetI [Salipiger sp. IMCC34102]|uniref:transcriptional regulator BetI n=1 Tax=Salipiger sp. IMCC34102 TaxID=2510647 RepID=UPI00101C85C3|nr:transcriptional regulator BetI [Salipiger sp. IMCC34102]RYH01838.1 transcriptional regulator BetI [Salipiger sp. IMCC34102]